MAIVRPELLAPSGAVLVRGGGTGLKETCRRRLYRSRDGLYRDQASCMWR